MPTQRELAPGAHIGTSPCVVPRLGAWGPTCRGPMHLFKCVILLFSMLYSLEHDLLDITLDFFNDKKLELRRNRYSGIIGK